MNYIQENQHFVSYGRDFLNHLNLVSPFNSNAVFIFKISILSALSDPACIQKDVPLDLFDHRLPFTVTTFVKLHRVLPLLFFFFPVRFISVCFLLLNSNTENPIYFGYTASIFFLKYNTKKCNSVNTGSHASCGTQMHVWDSFSAFSLIC